MQVGRRSVSQPGVASRCAVTESRLLNPFDDDPPISINYYITAHTQTPHRAAFYIKSLEMRLSRGGQEGWRGGGRVQHVEGYKEGRRFSMHDGITVL